MPDYLASTDPEPPIEIPATGGKIVTFKGCASYADELASETAALEAASAGGEGARWPAFVLTRTARMIVTWTLEDAAGDPLPVNPEMIGRLTSKVGSFLVEEARVRYEGRDEEAERPFVKPSSQLSVAE